MGKQLTRLRVKGEVSYNPCYKGVGHSKLYNYYLDTTTKHGTLLDLLSLLTNY